MTKGKVIDLITYRNDKDHVAPTAETAVSKELETAIKHLIHQLRELGPITSSD